MPQAASVSLPAEAQKQRSSRPVLQIIGTSIWMIGSLFLAAGRLNWTRGWICVAAWLACMPVVGLISHHYNPGLMRERAKWRRKDTKSFDKIFMAVYLPLVLAQPIVGGLDAVRYRWSALPFSWVYIGFALYLAAGALISWVLSINPYAESTVRIQTDRGHTVVTKGPYRIVRHPMYVGAALTYFGTPLILGSVWALVLGCVITVLFVVRTAFEDHALRRELPGYEEYSSRTRYRLVPGVW